MRNVPSCVPHDILPNDMWGFVAGGYAACPSLAGDIDLWVNESDDNEDIEAATLLLRRQRILTHLMSRGFSFQEEQSLRTEAVDGDGYDNLPVTTMKVAKVMFYPKPIHIMVANASIVAVLKAFDVSTHQIAVTNRDQELRGPDWTPLNVLPVAFRVTETTIARMDKITKRYAHLRSTV